jgi:hypothetical protein
LGKAKGEHRTSNIERRTSRGEGTEKADLRNRSARDKEAFAGLSYDRLFPASQNDVGLVNGTSAFANGVVQRISDVINGAAGVHRDAAGTIESRVSSGPIIGAAGSGPATQGVHQPVRPRGSHHPDIVIAGIGDVEIVMDIDGERARGAKSGPGRDAISAAVHSGESGDRAHRPIDAFQPQLANRAIKLVRHIEIARAVQCDAGGLIESRYRAHAVGLAGAERRAGNCFHNPIRPKAFDFADGVIERIRNVQGSGVVCGDAHRPIESGNSIRAVAKAVRSGETGDGGDDPVRSIRAELPDGIVESVGDKKIAGSIEGDAGGLVEPGGAVCAVGRTAEAGSSGDSSDDRRRAVRGYLPDRVIKSVGHEKIAELVHRQSDGLIEPRLVVGAVIAAGHHGCAGDGYPDVGDLEVIGCRRMPTKREVRLGTGYHVGGRVIFGRRFNLRMQTDYRGEQKQARGDRLRDGKPSAMALGLWRIQLAAPFESNQSTAQTKVKRIGNEICDDGVVEGQLQHSTHSTHSTLNMEH